MRLSKGKIQPFIVSLDSRVIFSNADEGKKCVSQHQTILFVPPPNPPRLLSSSHLSFVHSKAPEESRTIACGVTNDLNEIGQLSIHA